jgi:hypothetical protein
VAPGVHDHRVCFGTTAVDTSYGVKGTRAPRNQQIRCGTVSCNIIAACGGISF